MQLCSGAPQGTAVVAASNRKVQGGGTVRVKGFPVNQACTQTRRVTPKAVLSAQGHADWQIPQGATAV